MLETRWLRWLGPGVIALGAVGTIASSAIGAGERPWTPQACVDEGGPLAAAQSAGPASPADLGSEAWFRLDPRLDRKGDLEGQRLALGIDGVHSSKVMDLPAESSASGPFGQLVLVGADDGVTSRIEAIDVAGGCSWIVAEEPAVIRRATVDTTSGTVYEMRVDRATRADLGIWSRPLDGSVAAVRVLGPIGGDERFGITYSTEFTWSLSGRTLAVQSCGEAACRTRVIDTEGGSVRTVEDLDLGTLIGLDQDALVSYVACSGLPCPIVATDLSTGARALLAEAAGVAQLVATPDGPRLVHEVFGNTGIALRAVTLDGSSGADLGVLPDQLRLHAAPSLANASTRLPAGWALLAPDGRLPFAGPGAQVQLRHVPDGAAVPLDEVAR